MRKLKDKHSGFGVAAIITATVCVVLFSFKATPNPYDTCPYLMKDQMGSYYDYSSMYKDADLAVIAKVTNVSAQSAEQGYMTLNITKIIKGDKGLDQILVSYTPASCNTTSCNSDLIPATTREYLFFLKRSSPKTATRILCLNQTSNGWVEHRDLHFSDLYSTPLDTLEKFLKSNKAVVPVP